MTNTKQAKRNRARLFHRFEQLAAGLANSDPESVKRARILLQVVAQKGNAVVLHDCIRGIILAWDSEQPGWDDMPV